MNQDKATKLLFARWGREFNDPPIKDQDIDIYCKRVDKYEFTIEEIAAGIERYAETFEYGQRRNWATLLKCINEVRNAGRNILPAGVAADMFVDHYNNWGSETRILKMGYDSQSVMLFKQTVRRLGNGIGQEEPKYARLKFIQVYESLVNYEMSIGGQSAKRLSDAIQAREQLTEGDGKIGAGIERLAGRMEAK